MRSEATKERESATDEGKIRESAKSEKPRSGERMQPTTQVVGTNFPGPSSPEGAKEKTGQLRTENRELKAESS